MSGNSPHNTIPYSRIERLILLVRNQKVILDDDLANLYEVETRRIFSRSWGLVLSFEMPDWHLKRKLAYQILIRLIASMDSLMETRFLFSVNGQSLVDCIVSNRQFISSS